MQEADVKKHLLLTLKCQDAVALAWKQIYIAAATVNASAMPVLCTQYFRAQGIHGQSPSPAQNAKLHFWL